MQNASKITIAIDGYSSCGKSTLAKALAQKMNYTFIDSGAMYRCVALFGIRNGCVLGAHKLNLSCVVSSLPQINIQFGEADEKGNRAVLLNQEDVSDEIRQLEVANIVSEVAAIEEVRSFLVKQQQELGSKGGVVMDGRDIGTVVFPNAQLKLFVTAKPEIRAQRRFLELQAKGETNSMEEILQNLKHRDRIDSTRAISPLTQAKDAQVLDNSEMSELEQLEFVLNLVKNKTTI
ncbi:(d)CMP kinase [Fluviicola taffensis]|uniref:Cytidylate kinase n=1 Tax=Fluviicola taffensis (strain DSM 16823 / NCIMB 13979 / RW262) TaxID=755732 RepID=F2IGV6_FLUTR|nr:(d)CMP kinase [Fluviicola taffensis]AEA44737.1 cytidylate kinase [Fluviicola taffensis DSM 16823]